MFTELDKLSEKYKKCEKQLCLIPQVAHFVDSWPSSSTGMDSLPSALKRKFRVGDFAASNHGFAPKRTKYSIYNNSGWAPFDGIWVIFLDSNAYLLTCCLCQYSTISLKDLHPINFLCSTSLIQNLHNLAVVCEHGISLSSNVRRTASATVTVSTIFLDLTHF